MILTKDKYTQLMLQRDRKDKLEIKFIGEREYLYSGWEINQITSHLNNLYYKNEIINTIKSSLNIGIKPENIIIMNESIKLNTAYTKYEEGTLNLNEESDLLNFYFLGSPISFYPNSKVYKMHILFEMVRDLYSSTNQTKVNSVSRRYLLNLLINKQEIIPNGEALKDLIKKLLIDFNKENLEEDSSILSDIQKKVDKLEKHYQLWDDVNKEGKEENKNVDIKGTKEISTNFEYTFKRYEKPIVCIYNEDSNSIDILCIDMIAMKYFKEKNARLLETKEIKQNSPLMISIGIAIGFLPTLLKLGESVNSARKSKKKYIEEEKNLQEEADRVKKEREESEEIVKKNEEILNSLNDATSIDSIEDKMDVIVAIEAVDNLGDEIRGNFGNLLEKKEISINGFENFK